MDKVTCFVVSRFPNIVLGYFNYLLFLTTLLDISLDYNVKLDDIWKTADLITTFYKNKLVFVERFISQLQL